MARAKELKELRGIYDMISLKNKKVLVTGAAGGIGRSTSCAFAEIGADVALMDIKSKEELLIKYANEISNLHGCKTLAVTGDVTDPDSVNKVISDVVKAFDTIDILHNNAGIAPFDDSSDISLETWNSIMAVNLTGIMLMGRTVANLIKSHKHKGSIVNTASIAGHIINDLGPTERTVIGYTTSKAAVRHVTKAMAMDYVNFGIRFNSVSPGYIISGMTEWDPKILEWCISKIPMKRLGSLDEVTGAVVFLASDLSLYATGTDIIVDGGYCVW